MNCSDISEFAPLYLTGELDAAKAEEFNAHLEACSACRLDLRQQAALDELVRTTVLAERIDSAPVEQRVTQAIQKQARLSPEWRSRSRIGMAAGIAALLALAVAGYRVMSSRPVPLYSAAARDHRVEIVERQPRKWLTETALIAGLAAKQGLPEFLPTTLSPAGYRLAQGRLCLLGGHIYLHLLYRNDEGQFSLFLHRGEGAEPAPTAIIASENVAGFGRGPLNGLIVTEQSLNRATQLAAFATSVL